MPNPDPPPPQRIRALALVLTAVTGFSGLVYEVAWQRGLASLIGSHGEATAAVLALFLGGLAIGYGLFGWLCRRRPERSPAGWLGLYGAVEIAIGVHALAFPWLLSLARAFSASLPTGGFLLDVALAGALLCPATVLMGATIPLLTQALARGPEDATRLHAQVYGWNTLGAFCGALAGGLLLIPTLGISGAILTMAGLNLGVGVVFIALRERAGTQGRPGAARPAAAGRPPPMSALLLAAGALGFAMMTLQTVLVRIGGLAFGASDWTFAVVVASFVLCIALGSFCVARLRVVPAHASLACALGLAGTVTLLYPLHQDAAFAAHRIRVMLPDDDGGFLAFQAAAAGSTLLVWLLPLALSGALLPLLFHDARRRAGAGSGPQGSAAALGSVAGRLYAWNTLGSVLGALLGGHFLLRILDLHQLFRVAIGAVLLIALALAHAGRPRVRPIPLLATALAWALLAALPAWEPGRLSTGHLRHRHASEQVYDNARQMADGQHAGGILFSADDPTTTVLVNEHGTEDERSSRALFTNGKSDGSLWPDYRTMSLLGLVPCLLSERCESAFVIGLGTGVSAGELAEIASVARVEVAEISSAVIAAEPLFAEGNRDAGRNPKVTIHHGDAYRMLLRTRQRFDVIASEPSHPRATGVEMLYAREFLAAARARLAPGGVYAQWFHAYEMDDATLALVLRTYATVFPDVAVWFAEGQDLLLLGFAREAPALDLPAIQARLAQPDVAAALSRSGIASLAAFLGHELIPSGVIDVEALPGPIHTLGHPRLGRAAAAAFHRNDEARLPRFLSAAARARGETASGLSRLEAAGTLDEAALEAMARTLCNSRAFECVTLLGLWQHRWPGSARAEAVRAEFEESLAPHLLPVRIRLLAQLFGDGVPGPLDAESAQRVSDHYLAYYHHGRPFPRAALDASLARCEGPACEDVRRAAEAFRGQPAVPAAGR